MGSGYRRVEDSIEGVKFFKKSNLKMEHKGVVTKMGCRVKDFSVYLIKTFVHTWSVRENIIESERLKPEDLVKFWDQDLRRRER